MLRQDTLLDPTKSVVKFLTRNVVIFQPEVYQQIVDTLLVEKYYISGFYYDSGSKVTTFLGFTTILV